MATKYGLVAFILGCVTVFLMSVVKQLPDEVTANLLIHLATLLLTGLATVGAWVAWMVVRYLESREKK